MNQELAANLELLHPDAFGWALHCSGGDATFAEDVLQSAYLKLAQGKALFDGRSAFKTWWFGVVRVTAQEEQRRLRFRASLLGKLIRQFTGEEHDPRPSPSRQLELNESAMQLREALVKLPPRQAEALHLVFYQDLTLAEAAEIMGVSIGSIRQHYERGKAKLRQLIQPDSSYE
jgi:RNA polymerase sigma factor (sigma-70 family)